MDERAWSVVDSFRVFMDEVVAASRGRGDGSVPALREALEAHLGPAAAQLPVVRLDVPGHQFVNLDVAKSALVEAQGGGTVVGIGGGDQRHHQTLGDMLQRWGPWSAPTGPVDRTRLETGPDSSREAVAFGVCSGMPVSRSPCCSGGPSHDSGASARSRSSGRPR